MSSARRYRLPLRASVPSALRLATIALVMIGFATAASAAAADQGTSPGQVNIVRQGQPPAKVPANTHYYSTIQAAVNASTAGDWVLIEPGVYHEQVKVTCAQSGIWIRGMNRNTVIIDGQHKVGQRHRNRQGQRRLGGKPHRPQLRIRPVVPG